MNVQFADELDQRKRKSPPQAEETRELPAAETPNGESPGGKMRKMTVQRKDQVDESNEGSSDGSWGEIKSHLGREPKKRSSEDGREPRRTENERHSIQIILRRNGPTVEIVIPRMTRKQQGAAQLTYSERSKTSIKRA